MWTPNPVIFTLFGREFYWYGVCIAVGVMLAVMLAMRLAKKKGIDGDTIIDLALVCMPCAIVGARIYYVLMTLDYYSRDWIRVFYFWEGGLAVYGGIIGGIIGGFFYIKRKKLDFWTIADIVAPCIALGQAIGRWGNFFNQEAYGEAVTNPALQFFPISVYIEALEGTAKGPWHMAAFFYESMWCFVLVAVLLWLLKRELKPGTVLLSYAALYGLERAIVEGVRTDSLMLGSIRVSQALSIVLVLVCGGILIKRLLDKRKPNDVADESLRLLTDEDEFFVEDEDGVEDADDVVSAASAESAEPIEPVSFAEPTVDVSEGADTYDEPASEMPISGEEALDADVPDESDEAAENIDPAADANADVEESGDKP